MLSSKITTTVPQLSQATRDFAKIAQVHHAAAENFNKHKEYLKRAKKISEEFRRSSASLREELQKAANDVREYCQQFRITESSPEALMLWAWMLQDDLPLAIDLLKWGVFKVLIAEVYQNNELFLKKWRWIAPIIRALNSFGVITELQAQFPEVPVALHLYSINSIPSFIATEETIKAKIFDAAHLAHRESMETHNAAAQAVTFKAWEAAKRLYEKHLTAYENAILKALEHVESVEQGYRLIELFREEFNRFSPGNPFATSTAWREALARGIFFQYFEKLRGQEHYSSQDRIGVGIAIYFTPERNEAFTTFIRSLAGRIPKKRWLAEVLVKIHGSRNYPIERPTLVLIRQFARSMSHGSVQDRLQKLLNNLQHEDAYEKESLHFSAHLTAEQESKLLGCDKDISFADKHALLRVRVSASGIDSNEVQQKFLTALDPTRSYTKLLASDVVTLQKSSKTNYFWLTRLSSIPFELSMKQIEFLTIVFGAEKLARLAPKVILQTLIRATTTQIAFKVNAVNTIYPIVYSTQQIEFLLQEMQGQVADEHKMNFAKLSQKQIPLSEEQEKIVERELESSIYARATLQVKYSTLQAMVCECDFFTWQDELYPADTSIGQEQALDAQFDFDWNVDLRSTKGEVITGEESKYSEEDPRSFSDSLGSSRKDSQLSNDSRSRSSAGSLDSLGSTEQLTVDEYVPGAYAMAFAGRQTVFAMQLERTLSKRALSDGRSDTVNLASVTKPKSKG